MTVNDPMKCDFNFKAFRLQAQHAYRFGRDSVILHARSQCATNRSFSNRRTEMGSDPASHTLSDKSLCSFQPKRLPLQQHLLKNLRPTLPLGWLRSRTGRLPSRSRAAVPQNDSSSCGPISTREKLIGRGSIFFGETSAACRLKIPRATTVLRKSCCLIESRYRAKTFIACEGKHCPQKNAFATRTRFRSSSNRIVRETRNSI